MMKKVKIILIVVVSMIFLTTCRKDFPRQMAIEIKGETHTSNSVTFSINVADLGGNSTVEYGVCYSETNASPTIADSIVLKTTSVAGIFAVDVTDLNPSKTYYFRAFIKSDEILYTDTIVVKTSTTTPILTTTEASNFNTTTASSGGNITSDGGAPVTARGVCWSTSQNPVVTGSHTTNGTGTGTFTSYITGLSSGTLYYVRAYATNSDGTSYGNQIILVTNAHAVGDSYQGGIIAYILQSGDPGYIAGEVHGLIAAPSNQSTGAEWGCYGTAIPGSDGLVMGTGNQNTIDITAGCTTVGIAAKLCSDLVLNGYSDWYLPSKDELNKLYLNRAAVGGFASSLYWSSSEYDGDVSYAAWIHNFANSNQYASNKSYAGYVRAIRAF